MSASLLNEKQKKVYEQEGLLLSDRRKVIWLAQTLTN